MRHCPNKKLFQYKNWLWGASSLLDMIAFSLATIQIFDVIEDVTILTSPTTLMSCFMAIVDGFYTLY